MKNKSFLFLCIAVISISLLIGSYRQHIVFLDKNILYKYLIQDNDNYYKTFTQKDMNVRKIQSVDEYHAYIQQSVGDFTRTQKQNITESIRKADSFFSQLNFPAVDNDKILNICWVIGCINGNLYEGGLPHTRINVILLPGDMLNNMSPDLTKTLIHEKIHVYQKLFPEDMKKYFTSKGLYVTGKRDISDNIRANPDSDEYIYKDCKGILYALDYISDPKHIEDVNKNGEDHPNEEMAYQIGDMYHATVFSNTL